MKYHDVEMKNNMLKEDMERAAEVIKKNAAFIKYHNKIIPRFATLEFNITGLCNRTCSFCPRVDPKLFPNTNKHLSLELYEKILQELVDINASPRITYSGFSEPLLHPNLADLVSLTYNLRPEIPLEIKTNGDKLNTEKMRDLFDKGLKYLVISLYDGINSEIKFERMRNEAGLTKKQVILRVRYYTEEHGYNLNLSNRGGTVGAGFKELLTINGPLKNKCHYPSMMMMIDYNGDVLLCPHDWGKKLVTANIKYTSIMDAWTSTILHNVRKSLKNADRNFSPCDVCNVNGTLTGKESQKQWENYYSGKILTD